MPKHEVDFEARLNGGNAKGYVPGVWVPVDDFRRVLRRVLWLPRGRRHGNGTHRLCVSVASTAVDAL
jgi:hypothetical protein